MHLEGDSVAFLTIAQSLLPSFPPQGIEQDLTQLAPSASGTLQCLCHHVVGEHLCFPNNTALQGMLCGINCALEWAGSGHCISTIILVPSVNMDGSITPGSRSETRLIAMEICSWPS